MHFFFGLIVGILIAILVILVEKSAERRGETIVSALEKSLERKQYGLVIEPKSETQVAIEEVFAKNDAEGRDTPIEEIS